MSTLSVTAVAIAALFVTGTTATASPATTSGIGMFAPGTSYVIEGSGFGPKASAQPVRFDDFEAGTPNETLSGWSLSSDQGRDPVYSTTYQRPHSTQNARCLFDESQRLCSFGVESTADIPEVYLDAWYLYDPADPPSPNHKLFRFYPGAASGAPNLYFNVHCDPGAGAHLSQAGVDSGNCHVWIDWPWSAADKRWVHIQGYFKASSTTADDGVARLWIDSAELVNLQSFRTRTETNPTMWHSVWLGNYLGHDAAGACPASPGPSYTYWDDVYIDFTPARVELGNAPTYDACTQREIQVPTQWSDTSITITVNGGSFPPGSELYLFVVDHNGEVSYGFPVILDGGSGPDITPPATVITLAVSTTGQTSATLTWVAVGDDGHTGTATTYDLRYSTAFITPANWTSATQATGEPAPKAAGEGEIFTVTGLAPETSYYFALKVADEASNWSTLSNVASDATLAAAVLTPVAPAYDLASLTVEVMDHDVFLPSLTKRPVRQEAP